MLFNYSKIFVGKKNTLNKILYKLNITLLYPYNDISKEKKSLSQVKNKGCIFCSKTQPELNLFCVECNRRNWITDEIKMSTNKWEY